MYTRKSLLGLWVFFEQSLSPGFGLSLTKCRRKTKSLFEERKVKSRFLDLVNFFFKQNNFSIFEKMLWGSGAIFLRLLVSHREKISRWKNLFVFQRLIFLYQLVNLVLETCFIFSEILKLSKTYFFLSWVFSCSLITQTTSVMILLFQIIYRNSVLQSQLWCPSWIFDTSFWEDVLFVDL